MFKIVLVQCVLLLFIMVCAEFGLRFTKSFVGDGGTVVLHRSSINSQSDSEFGWFAPRDEQVAYLRVCYGDITATYNEHGQRLDYEPNTTKSVGVKRICVVGDSTTRAYQVTDGTPDYHLLQQRLDPTRSAIEILPMAVGGFGTLQQSMLLKKSCLSFQPDLIVWQLDNIDLTNNLFERENYEGSNNNFRRRPYWEDGKIVYRRPMVLPDWFDSVALRLVSAFLSQSFADPDRAARVTPLAVQATASVLDQYLVALAVPKVMFFSGKPNTDLASVLIKRGFEQVDIADMSDDHLCAEFVDMHRNSKGHEQLADHLEPVIRRLLKLVA